MQLASTGPSYKITFSKAGTDTMELAEVEQWKLEDIVCQWLALGAFIDVTFRTPDGGVITITKE